MISGLFQSKPVNSTVIQVYAPTTNAEEAEVERFYENLQDLLELIQKKKRCPFHHRGLECKSKKSRDTWSDRQIWPWCTKWSRAKLTDFCQENALVTANSLSSNTRDDSTQGHHQIVNTESRLTIFFAVEDEEALYSQQEQDWELTMAQIMNSLL